MHPQLILFVRAPALGRGKHRLARDIGAVPALRFERLMIARLLRRLARDRRWRLRIAVTPDYACRGRGQWCGGIAIVPQGAGDLGIRMQRTIAHAPLGPIVLIGADIPAIATRHIAVAFRKLETYDVVFGPAADGGFWLVGARRRPRLPPLFGQVRWSSPHALADVLAELPRGVRVGFAETLEDVDDGEAFHRLKPERGF